MSYSWRYFNRWFSSSRLDEQHHKLHRSALGQILHKSLLDSTAKSSAISRKCISRTGSSISHAIHTSDRSYLPTDLAWPLGASVTVLSRPCHVAGARRFLMIGKGGWWEMKLYMIHLPRRCVSLMYVVECMYGVQMEKGVGWTIEVDMLPPFSFWIPHVEFRHQSMGIWEVYSTK